MMCQLRSNQLHNKWVQIKNALIKFDLTIPIEIELMIYWLKSSYQHVSQGRANNVLIDVGIMIKVVSMIVR